MKRNPKPKSRNPNQPKGKTPAQQPQTRTALFLTPLRPNQPPPSFSRSAQQPTLQPNRARASTRSPACSASTQSSQAQVNPDRPSSFCLARFLSSRALSSPARQPSPQPVPASGPNLSPSRSTLPQPSSPSAQRTRGFSAWPTSQWHQATQRPRGCVQPAHRSAPHSARRERQQTASPLSLRANSSAQLASPSL